MPAFALAISLIVLSHSGIFIRFANADALAIGFWRMGIAVPLLALMVVMQGQSGMVRRLSSRQWGSLALCGLSLFIHWWTWFLAVQKTSLANSMVLFAVSPLFTAAGAWLFFGERLLRRHAVAMFCCFAGVLVLFYGSISLDPGHLPGDFLGLVSSVLFSAYVLVGKGIRRELANLPFTFVTYTFSGLFFLVALCSFSLPIATYDNQTWAAFVVLAIGPTLLGHALLTYCMQFFSVNLISILILSEPVIASVSAYFIFQEPLTFHQLLGFFAIAVGVAALFVPHPRALKRVWGRA